MNIATKRPTREEILAQFCRQDPVMLFSFGKVGSTALAQAFYQYLGRAYIRAEQLPIAYGNKTLQELGGIRMSELIDHVLDRYVHETITAAPTGGDEQETRLKIITPIREPIGRDVASFFEAKLQKFLGVTHARQVPEKETNVVAKRALKGLSGLLPRPLKSGIRRVVPRSPTRSGGWVYEDKDVQRIKNLD